MSETTITRDRFQSVRGRVPEVQYAAREMIGARNIFALIIHHDTRFEGALRGDETFQSCAGCPPLFPLTAKIVAGLIEELAASGRALFDGLAPSGGQLSARQCVERARVSEDGPVLLKCTGQVFSGVQIDGRFAAHRSVYLCEQGCGNLEERKAAQVER